MPIPALTVKSPQTWKKKHSYPSDKLIAKRRQAAFGKPAKSIKRTKQEKVKLPKRKTSYYGQRDSGQWKTKILKLIIKWGIIVAIAVAIIVASIFFYYSGQVPTREEFLASTEGSTTKIYDRTGEHLLYNISGDQKKSWIPLDQLPQHVKWAVISIEDQEFYSHRGLDFPALIKVFLHEAFGIGPPRGGSTITQQLVKNALLTSERSYKRKFKEMVISYHMEKKFSKDEILELYFNVIPYGSTAYGVEAAAETYFGKNARELDLSEAAVLAAMLQATTYYSPYGTHTEELFQRQRLVLSIMADLGYITETEAQAAREKKLEFKRLSQNIEAPHYVLYIKELLAAKYGEEMVTKGGLKVITTLDFDKQKIAEAAITAGVERNEANYGAHNASLVSINARTGEVLAMVGSRDYFNEEYDGAVNVSMRPRQPGSSFKPIVYAASFMEGLSPDTILFDTLTTFKTEIGEDYEPHNYDGKEYGPVSIRKAIAGSLNIPAVKTIYLTGVDNVLNLAEKLGYTTFEDRSRFGLSLVLGGGEVKLIDHVRAFATLARNGERHNLQYLLKVEDMDGRTLEEFKPEKNKGEEVMDSEIAKQVNDVLSDNEARAYVFGLNSYLTLGGRPVAAKTGTTNDYRDGWTIGYTPSLVTGVWVGNNDNTVMTGKAAGGNVAAPIWNEYMKKALEGTPVEHFEKPGPLELPQKPMLNGKEGQENIVQIDKISGKLSTANTPPEFIEEKTFKEVHSILHYVNTKNILGSIPEHPERDSNYTSWEEGIKKWAEANDYEIAESMPTEYDDIHTDENKPDITINNPSNNTHFNNPNLDVVVSVHTTRSINRVEYYIGDQLISTKTRYPYNLNSYQLLGFSNGEKSLRARAVDDVGNWREANVKIYINLPEEYSKPVVWVSPTDTQQIHPESFPYNLSIAINNHTLYQKADFYIKKSDQSSVWVDYSPITGPAVNVLLLEADPGQYNFYVVLTRTNGDTLQGEGIKVRVE